MTTLLVVTSDEHVNSRYGLCVQPVQQDEGGTFAPSATQLAVAAAWRQFWLDARARAKKLRAKVWWVNVGDAVDMNKHDPQDPVTSNKARLMDLAMATYKPIMDFTQHRFVIRGTEAHTGNHSEMEDLVGRELEAVHCPDTDAPSWYHLVLECDGVLFDIQHHPRGGGALPWTRNAMASRLAAEVSMEYSERGERVPDVVLRGHVHYASDSGVMRKPRVFTLDGWQALTPHAHRRGYFMPSPVGGMWFECSDGAYKEARWYREPKRQGTWRVPSK